MLIWAILTVIGIHAMWLYGSMAFDWLFLLGATFCLSAVFLPLMPVAAETVMLISYAQQYIMVLMAGMTLLRVRGKLLRGSCGAMMVFAGLLMIATLYSLNRYDAIKMQAQWVMIIMAGMGMALAVPTLYRLRRNLRLLLIPAFIAAVFYSQSISGLGVRDRLEVAGGNANSIGMLIATVLIPIVFIVAWDPIWWMRPAAGLCALWLLVPLIASGSRTAFAAAVAGSMAIIFPLLRKPLVMLVVVGGLAIGAYWMLQGMENGGLERLTDYSNFSGRERIWAKALAHRDRMGDVLGPLIGAGTYLEPLKTGNLVIANCHSMYVQILTEVGYVGMAAFAAMTIFMFWRSLNTVLRSNMPEKWLALGVITLTMLMGVAEAAPITTRVFTTLFWGFGIGLLDRVYYDDDQAQPQFVTEQFRQYQNEMAMA